jgi:hypothetical protein
MPLVPCGGLNFSDLAWTFKMLPSKHIEISIWYARPFTSMF